jgi:hypothetical protein
MPIALGVTFRSVFLFVAVGACASNGPPAETTPRQTQIYQSDKGVIVGANPRASSTTIPLAPATVWAAVRKVYLDLEIPVTVENPSAHQIGNNNFAKSRTFAGRPMETLIDCGRSMTGPKAATYKIYMSLLTDVRTDEKGGTLVQTTFVPVGQDIVGSGDRVPCGTSGDLEQIVLSRVKAAVGKP